MNLIFVSPMDEGIYGGYEDAKFLARKHSGCNVICLDKTDSRAHDREFLKQIGRRGQKSRLDMTALERHFIVLDHIEANHLEPPFVFPDWDFMVFQNLEQAFIPHMGCDWASSVHNDGNMMPAHFLTNVDALREFCGITIELINGLSKEDYLHNFHDMIVWKKVSETGKFKVGNTLEIHDGSAFDCGMQCNSIKDLPIAYKAEADGYKELTWKDGIPFFETLDGQKVKANWIHCWGKYKTRTKELVAKSETGFTSQ